MNHLAIFAKYWEAGKVKTRLAKSIGDQLARDVYYVFLHYLVSKLENFGDIRTVMFTPKEKQDEFRKSISEDWRLAPQSEGDLGLRMKTFFESFDHSGEQKNILIGSDTPDLPVEYLEQTLEALDRVPFVLGPSQDGGYYLIACRGSAPPVFDNIPWSSPHVLPLTLGKLATERCPYELLPELKDVDEVEDLKRLIDELNASGNDPKLLEELYRLGVGNE